MSTTLPMNSENTDTPVPEEALPELKVQRRQLPTGIASNVKQHVLIVRDRSTSMAGDKIAELNQASESLIRELGNPLNRDGFRVSVVDFNNQAQLICMGEAAENLHVPTATAAGGTNFTHALEETLDALDAFKNLPNDAGWHFLRPVTLFLSDGQAQADEQLIMDLQEESQVIAIAYGSDADQATLAKISSDGKVQVIGTDGGALRQFLAEVGKTLSQAMQTKH